jgi:hypothetical protein
MAKASPAAKAAIRTVKAAASRMAMAAGAVLALVPRAAVMPDNRRVVDISNGATAELLRDARPKLAAEAMARVMARVMSSNSHPAGTKIVPRGAALRQATFARKVEGKAMVTAMLRVSPVRLARFVAMDAAPAPKPHSAMPGTSGTAAAAVPETTAGHKAIDLSAGKAKTSAQTVRP